MYLSERLTGEVVCTVLEDHGTFSRSVALQQAANRSSVGRAGESWPVRPASVEQCRCDNVSGLVSVPPVGAGDDRVQVGAAEAKVPQFSVAESLQRLNFPRSLSTSQPRGAESNEDRV